MNNNILFLDFCSIKRFQLMLYRLSHLMLRTFEENKFLRSCMYKEGGIKNFKFLAQLFCDKFCFRHYRNRHKFCRLVAVCQRICNTF